MKWGGDFPRLIRHKILRIQAFAPIKHIYGAVPGSYGYAYCLGVPLIRVGFYQVFLSKVYILYLYTGSFSGGDIVSYYHANVC